MADLLLRESAILAQAGMLMPLRAPLNRKREEAPRLGHCERSEAISVFAGDCVVAEPVLSVTKWSQRAPRNDIIRPPVSFSEA